MLPGNIFGLILKNKMAARDVYSTLNKDFCWPSRAKGIIGRDLKFAGYVPHYKILTGNNFGLILKNKMAATGVFMSADLSVSWHYVVTLRRGGVRVRVNNFSSKTTRPRDVLFFLKDTLSIEDEKLFKACKSVCSSVC